MTRKKKATRERRTELLTIRMSVDERRKLAAIAECEGLSESSLVRHLVAANYRALFGMKPARGRRG